MEEDGWQTIGTTLDRNYPDTTHIHPNSIPNSANRNRTSSLPRENRQQANVPLNRKGTTVRRGSLRRRTSTGAESIATTPSLRRQNAVKLTPVQKVRRFFRRFTWWKRARRYSFGKRYLRRQSSFVVTPDQSTSNFRFRTRDLVAKRPRPDSWRSSRPVQAWKATDPMAVLSGKVNLPNQAKSPNTKRPQPPSTPTPTVPSPIRKHVRHQVDPRYTPDATAVLDRNDTRQSWVKVSLPVRKPVVQEPLPHKASHTSLASTEEAEAPTTPRTPTRGQYGTDSPIRNIAPTPTTGKSKSDEYVASVRSSFPAAESLAGEATIASLAMSPPRREMGSPEAVTHQGDAQSPTSARAQFRPASWRRSAAILPRELSRRASSRRSRRSRHRAEASVIISDELDLELDEAMEFVGAWSAYLRRAVAVRAIIQREEKTWEVEKEQRWATSPYLDSNEYSASSEYDSSSAGDMESTGSIRRAALDSGSDTESMISNAEAQFNSDDDDTSPEFDPEEGYPDINPQQLVSQHYGSSGDGSSSSNNLESMPHRYSALFNTASSSDRDVVYNTASESSFPGLTSTWKMEEQPELPAVPPPGIVPVSALRVTKSPEGSFVASPSATTLTMVSPSVAPGPSTPSAIAITTSSTPTSVTVTPAASKLAPDHKRMESFDFAQPAPESDHEVSPKPASNERGGELLQGYYRERRAQHEARASQGKTTLSAISDEASEGEEYKLEKETILLRQNTMRSNWGAAASDDGSSDSA